MEALIMSISNNYIRLDQERLCAIQQKLKVCREYYAKLFHVSRHTLQKAEAHVRDKGAMVAYVSKRTHGARLAAGSSFENFQDKFKSTHIILWLKNLARTHQCQPNRQVTILSYTHRSQVS